MHDLKSRLNAASYIYNPSKPPFEKGGFVVSLRLNSPAVSVLSKSPSFIAARHKFCANRKIERPKIFS